MPTQVFIGDVQYPFHDPRVLNLFGKFCRNVQPDEIHYLGDWIDCYSIKNPKYIDTARFDKQLSLEKEINGCKELLRRVQESCPSALHVFYYGNHENRYAKYLKTGCPEIYAITGRDFLGLESMGFTVHPYGKCVQYGGLSVVHGSIIRSDSGKTARAMLQKYGRSIIHGHTHRGGIVYLSNDKETIMGIENFCACELQQPWTFGPCDWQQGWTVIYNDYLNNARIKDCASFHVVQVPVTNYCYTFLGDFHAKGESNTGIASGLPRIKQI